MSSLRPALGAAALVAGLSLLLPVAQALAQAPPATPPIVRLHYTFQPDCFRSPADPLRCISPRERRLDLGPQIAVWLEKEGAGYVSDLMVTNLVARMGIGNRPGYWAFPSTWRFPYGKRVMALPVWAHRRGKLYPQLVLQDDGGASGGEMGIGFHESVSSTDPYHCLSFKPPTWVYDFDSVDAITCATSVFSSSKGRFLKDDKGQQVMTYYPPRSDVGSSTRNDCPAPGDCPTDQRAVTQFRALNDLDAVATATPAYGQPYAGVWEVPSDLPDGDYAVLLEISKEFDNNDHHAHPSFVDSRLPDAGFTNNFGQPSVVFRVPIHIDRTVAHQGAVSAIAGYGDWDGATGTLHAADDSISDTPGSGAGRLLTIMEPGEDGNPAPGRLHVATELFVPTPCDASLAGTGNITGLEVVSGSLTPMGATLHFTEPGEAGKPVQRYDIRYRLGSSMNESEFKQAVPAPTLRGGPPGQQRSFQLSGLKSSSAYTVGVRAHGGCIGDGPLSFVTFTTPRTEFTQLSGCFIATAAYGSALAPELARMRQVRDAVRDRGALGAALVDGYERSSPPVADVLRRSELGRAVVRTLLAPAAQLLGR